MQRPIHHSARKHGIADEDILHAIEHAIVVVDIDEDEDELVLHLGPDAAGNLLEVIERSSVVIHAMTMRAKYQPLLRGLGEADD
jgi:hypothetical protein